MNGLALSSLLPLVTTAVLAGCGASLTAPEVTPDPVPVVSHLTSTVGDTVALELGQSVTFAPTGTEVTFLRLVGDSRCPVGLTCVWEGDAEVELRVGTDDGDSDLRLHTTLEPRSVTMGAFVLELVDVLPHPTDDPATDPATPRVVISLRSTTD